MVVVLSLDVVKRVRFCRRMIICECQCVLIGGCRACNDCCSGYAGRSLDTGSYLVVWCRAYSIFGRHRLIEVGWELQKGASMVERLECRDSHTLLKILV